MSGIRYDNIAVSQVGTPITTAQITVCSGTGHLEIPCFPSTPVYQDEILTLPLTQPIATGPLGNFGFYASPGDYTYSVTGFQVVGANFPITLGTSGGAGGNAAIKPTFADAMQYVTTEGNDSNDGLSWGSAKLTIFGACEALPGGAVSPTTCGKGTIFVTDGVSANPTAGAGIWLMGGFDPNYASPPAGWLRLGGPLQIIGVGCKNQAANSRMGQCSIGAGAQTDNNHPALWLSGSSNSLKFENLLLPSGRTGIRMGVDSTGNRSSTSGQVVNAFFKNVAAQMGLAPATNGPTVDIGSNTFFNGFRDCNFAGNANAALGSDLAASMLLNPGSGTGVGIIFIEDTNFAGGPLKFYPGANGGGFYLNGSTMEGLTGTNGGIWITSTNGNVNIQIQNFQMADSVSNAPAIEVDGNGPPDAVIVSNTSGPLVGPMVFNGVTPASLFQAKVIPSKYHQTGFAGGHLLGQTDAARRGFSPVAVRYPNLAASNPASWAFTAGGSITTGLAAPDGTTNAATCSSSSGNVNCLFYDANRTYAVGDILVIGAWARSRNGNGVGRGQSLSLFLASAGFTYQDISGQGGISSQLFVSNYIQGDGTSGNPPSQWDWYWEVFKIKTIGTNPTETQFFGPIDNTSPTDYFAPIFLHIAANTISDNEASELGQNLQSYGTAAGIGAIAGLPGQTLLESAFQSYGTLFTGLGTPANGTFLYCSDCNITNPCAGGGTGAIAKRLGGVWVCN